MASTSITIDVTGIEPMKAVVEALRRLAVADEMAGMGDVEDAEGLARIAHARSALEAAGLSWKRSGALPPRSFSLPPEPGPEVTAVSAVAGEILFTRDLMDPRYWAGRFVHSGRSFGTPLSWRALVSQYDLTDATQETK